MSLRDVVIVCLILINMIAWPTKSAAGITNGIGEYTEVGKQQFIVALTTPRGVYRAERLLEQAFPAQLTVGITAKKMSKRRLINLWREGILVNTDSATMLKQMANFNKFSEFIQGELAENDILSLDYSEQSLEVYFNDVKLGVIDSDDSGEFFRLLLSSWIGATPISSKMRRDLLSPNKIDQKLLDRYQRLSYSAKQKQKAQNWQQTIRQLAQTERSEANLLGEIAETTMEMAAVLQSDRLSIDNKEASTTAATTVVPDTRSTTLAAVTTVAPDARSTTLAAAATPELKTPKPIKARSLEPNDNKLRSSRADGPQENSAGDAELEEQRKQYYTELSNAVLKHQTLPQKAFQYRMQGDISVQVRIDRKGELLGVTLDRASKHKVLNKQAIEAVRKAAPFEPFPYPTGKKTFSFTIPMSYRLPY